MKDNSSVDRVTFGMARLVQILALISIHSLNQPKNVYQDGQDRLLWIVQYKNANMFIFCDLMQTNVSTRTVSGICPNLFLFKHRSEESYLSIVNI